MQGPACTKKLKFGASVEDISHQCPMSCHKSVSTIISETAEETFVITQSNNSRKLNCQNSTQILHESACQVLFKYAYPAIVK